MGCVWQVLHYYEWEFFVLGLLFFFLLTSLWIVMCQMVLRLVHVITGIIKSTENSMPAKFHVTWWWWMMRVVLTWSKAGQWSMMETLPGSRPSLWHLLQRWCYRNNWRKKLKKTMIKRVCMRKKGQEMEWLDLCQLIKWGQIFSSFLFGWYNRK